ncbi:hypothetical protein BMA10247_A0715 [Burkholderia mallei NCTC 10247]|nr:hypothetical protein BMA10247_A0715 [Burkholderia mallei NCTC 10247]EBA46638.1 hypothetical protein BURPS305_2212 [Burkholderia pseudomallei 305]EEP84742.1 conserved hypothetical protein [Burkholderia mallei GB8 horse 4]
MREAGPKPARRDSPQRQRRARPVSAANGLARLTIRSCTLNRTEGAAR